MKHELIYNVLKHLKSKPQATKTLKKFLIFGLLGFVVLSGLTIWAGIAAFRYASQSARAVIESPAAQMQVDQIKNQVSELQFQPLSCWDKAQGLMTIRPWLERPALDNLKNLKVACLTPPETPAEGRTI